MGRIRTVILPVSGGIGLSRYQKQISHSHMKDTVPPVQPCQVRQRAPSLQAGLNPVQPSGRNDKLRLKAACEVLSLRHLYCRCPGNHRRIIVFPHNAHYRRGGGNAHFNGRWVYLISSCQFHRGLSLFLLYDFPVRRTGCQCDSMHMAALISLPVNLPGMSNLMSRCLRGSIRLLFPGRNIHDPSGFFR